MREELQGWREALTDKVLMGTLLLRVLYVLIGVIVGLVSESWITAVAVALGITVLASLVQIRTTGTID